jgi:23S rRNA (adenine-N6)-dimethyltransferase
MSETRNAGASASLWVSQNYLTSSHTIQKILDRANLLPTDHVIEIGPGKGHITRAVLRQGDGS